MGCARRVTRRRRAIRWRSGALRTTVHRPRRRRPRLRIGSGRPRSGQGRGCRHLPRCLAPVARRPGPGPCVVARSDPSDAGGTAAESASPASTRRASCPRRPGARRVRRAAGGRHRSIRGDGRVGKAQRRRSRNCSAWWRGTDSTTAKRPKSSHVCPRPLPSDSIAPGDASKLLFRPRTAFDGPTIPTFASTAARPPRTGLRRCRVTAPDALDRLAAARPEVAGRTAEVPPPTSAPSSSGRSSRVRRAHSHSIDGGGPS